MKYHNKVKRLRRKQKDYDDMIQRRPELKLAYSRPGSIKKS